MPLMDDHPVSATLAHLLEGLEYHWSELPTIGRPIDEDVIRGAATVLAVWRKLRGPPQEGVELVMALERCGERLSGPSRAAVASLAARQGLPTLNEINGLAAELCLLHGPRADLARRLWMRLAGVKDTPKNLNKQVQT
jgi:hypothetical protein